MESGRYSAFTDLVSNTVRLTALLWRDKKVTVLLLCVIGLLISAAPFIQSGALGYLINTLISSSEGTADRGIALAATWLVLASTIPSLLQIFQSYLGKMFWFYLDEKFELMIIDRKGELDIASHEDPKQNDMIAKVEENGTWRLRNFADRQFYMLQNVIEVIIASAILLYSEWWVFLILLVGTLPELITEVRHGDDIWGIYAAKTEIRRRYWDIQHHYERIATLIEMKLLGTGPKFLRWMRRLFNEFQTEERNKETIKIRRQLYSLTASQLSLGFTTIWFIYQVSAGHIEIGTLTFILAAIVELRRSLSGLFMNLGRQYQDSLFVTDVFRFLDTEPMVTYPTDGKVLKADETPTIVFDNISFSYPRTNEVVLKNFSLTITPGEKVAIIGVNGAGKSTFVKLLCRFYDPTTGRIMVGGEDLSQVNILSWYRLLGVLLQDYAHYHFPVKEAIAIGDLTRSLSSEQVTVAAKRAEAQEFILKWKKKYSQMLGNKFTDGVEPSIGQWQKLALARMFYRDPRIWILDEPTSSIDAEAEANIFEKLEALPDDRTVILISHRFSTVRRADRIIVLDDGKIKESGNHHELMERDGLYARLFKLQAKGYQE